MAHNNWLSPNVPTKVKKLIFKMKQGEVEDCHRMYKGKKIVSPTKAMLSQTLIVALHFLSAQVLVFMRALLGGGQYYMNLDEPVMCAISGTFCQICLFLFLQI